MPHILLGITRRLRQKARDMRIPLFPSLAGAALLLAAGAYAQIEGGRGVAPVDSSGDFEVSGVDVDVAARTAQAARLGGWRLAQRKGGKKAAACFTYGLKISPSP